jgi:hypothetical protein
MVRLPAPADRDCTHFLSGGVAITAEMLTMRACRFILFKYLVALCLTAFTKEDFINIAWDSAGVTTGPVTVPFVLSIGVGCSKAVRAEEGFGILACASVWPIITVLLVDGIRRAYARSRSPLIRGPVHPQLLQKRYCR